MFRTRVHVACCLAGVEKEAEPERMGLFGRRGYTLVLNEQLLWLGGY